MTHKVGAKGQVVIPKAIRDEFGIVPGDEIVFESVGDQIRIHRLADETERRRQGIEALRGAWADIPGLSTKDLEAERRQERAREERKAQGLLGDSP